MQLQHVRANLQSIWNTNQTRIKIFCQMGIGLQPSMIKSKAFFRYVARPIELWLGILHCFAQNWEFLAKYTSIMLKAVLQNL